MGRATGRWRYAVALAVAAYALVWVFHGDLFSSRTFFVLGVITLFVGLGLLLRFSGSRTSRR